MEIIYIVLDELNQSRHAENNTSARDHIADFHDSIWIAWNQLRLQYFGIQDNPGKVIHVLENFWIQETLRVILQSFSCCPLAQFDQIWFW